MRDRRERTLKAGGDTWAVRLGRRPPGPDMQVVLFFCRTTDQRPYRVVEVPTERLPDEESLAALSRAELEELFESSRSMDFPRTLHADTPPPS